jgi:hypothetical protein
VTEAIDLKTDPLVNAITAVIARTIEMGIAAEDVHILDALTYVYAIMQRYNDGTRPHKLN